MHDLDQLWTELLSEDTARIRRAWENLTDEEAGAILAHLSRMQSEDGWAVSQRAASTAALRVLRDQAR